MIGNECPECNHPLGEEAKCRACGWEAASEAKPTLPAYREFKDRRASFRGCEHVPVGQRDPCAPCAAEVAKWRAEFRRHTQKISDRNVTL